MELCFYQEHVAKKPNIYNDPSYSSFLLEERCRFLSVFSIATADVELPGEFLMPKSNMVSQKTLHYNPNY